MADNPSLRDNKIQASPVVSNSQDSLVDMKQNQLGKDLVKRNEESVRSSKESGTFFPDIVVRDTTTFIHGMSKLTKITTSEPSQNERPTPDAVRILEPDLSTPAHILDDSVVNNTDREKLLEKGNLGQISEVQVQDNSDDDKLVTQSTQKSRKAKRNSGGCCKNESDEEHPNQMTIEESKTYVRDLIKDQEDLYHKKFAFGRGRFQECIPNPDPARPNEMITVQLVNRIFKELEQSGDFKKLTLYKKYMVEQTMDGRRALYGDIDKVSGVSASHYGYVKGVDSQENDVFKALTSCEEYAIIAFWSLHPEDDTFECDNFFYVPNPQKRTIRKDENVEVSQVLYSSPHTKDIYLFYKGCLSDKTICDGTQVMQCAILRNSSTQTKELCENNHELKHMTLSVNDGINLYACSNCTREKITKDFFRCEQCNFNLCLDCEMEHIYDDHDVRNHCQRNIQIDENCLLHKYIEELHTVAFDLQVQQPNPMLIDTVSLDSEGNAESTSEGEKTMAQKTVVFTSKKLADGGKSWYPSIFFHDLDKNQTTWQIHGAEIFVSIDQEDPDKHLKVLTNEIWSQISQQKYEGLVRQSSNEFSRHREYNTYMIELKYGAKKAQDKNKLMGEKKNHTKLNFQNNPRLDITQNAKVVEAYSHDGDRLTLLYQNLGSFTFDINEPQKLHQPQSWFIKQGDKTEEKLLRIDQILDEKNKRRIRLIDQQREVQIVFDPIEKSDWEGNFCGDTDEINEDDQVKLHALVFTQVENDRQSWTVKGTASNSQQIQYMNVEGTIKNERAITFSLKNESQQEIKVFKGTIDLEQVHMTGKWEGEQDQRDFEFDLAGKIKGIMDLQFKDWPKIAKRIEIDLQTMKIYNIHDDLKLRPLSPRTSKPIDFNEENEEITEFKAVSHFSQVADICFFIQNRDVSFLRTIEKVYIQANLRATSGIDEQERNGPGVAQASITLYNISEDVVESNTYGNQQVAVVGEPNGQKHVKFGLNQTFMRTQEKNEHKLYHVCPSIIGHHNVYDDQTREFQKSGLRLFGSVIYEDYSTGILGLNFFTASLDETSEARDYPQQPLSQQMIVDYPYLAYKTVSPTNNEIAIVHMAQKDVPQKMINLGEMRFICFVGHTQMAEQRLFLKEQETNCDIMFLVQFKDENSLRLVSLKMNPWLKDDDNKDFKDSEICKHDLFIFSGSLNEVPDQENQISKKDYIANRKKYCRQFSNDKIQTAELITAHKDGYNQYMVIIQYNGGIASASLNTSKMEIQCESKQMVRRHMVRGYDDRIFYCESNGATEAIIELNLDTKVKNKITREQIQTFNGSQIVAFELDNERILNDHLEDTRQSLYVMDDRARVYRLENPDGERYIVSNTRDLSQHKKLIDHLHTYDNDWDRLHMTKKTVTYDNVTYNLQNHLQVNLKVPPTDAGDKWEIESTEIMSMTTNQISMCQTPNNDFCFFVKPAPSSRKLTIMGFKFLHAIDQMLFISNEHILCKFSGGQTVTLHKNGDIKHQNVEVQELLDLKSSLVAEQAIHSNNHNLILLRDCDDRYILVRFDEQGEASQAGIFVDIYKQMGDQIKNYESESIEYQQEFFITPDGEILKFAAKVDQSLANDEKTYISEYQIKSTEEAECEFQFTIIVLHFRTEKEKSNFVRHSQLCVVGNTLCYRRNSSSNIQIVNLKNENKNKKMMQVEKQKFSIKAMIHDPRDFQQIQMTEISEAYHKTVKETKVDDLIKEMLQITVRSNAILIALDCVNIKEISQIENIQPLLNADKTVRSRFIMTKIQKDNKNQTTLSSQIDMSKDCNLRIWREYKKIDQKEGKTEMLQGMLYRTFTEMNLWQLDQIVSDIESRQKIDRIGDGAILSTYNGQTIFSIFSGQEEVYDQILEQLRGMKFKDEQDDEGQDVEHNYLRRLYRILILYVPDIEKRLKVDQVIKSKTCYQKALKWTEELFGIDQVLEGKSTGFKSITRKSLYFESSAQSEILMELAMMCKENSLTDFVGDISDFTFLINSMSPVVRELISNSFKHSAYTQNVKNLDWQIGGKQQQVFGTNTQLISQYHEKLNFEEVKQKKVNDNPLRRAISCFTKTQFQKRQVEVEMLDISWIFANECDVRQLIVSLMNCPYDSVFSTDLVISLVDIFNDKYKTEIILKCFLPYLVYFLTTIIFFELFTSAGIHMNNEDEKWVAYAMAIVIIVLDLYFLFLEVVVIVRDGIQDYITSTFFNYLDVITSILNVILVYRTFNESDETQADRSSIKNLTVLAILLMWTNLFDWYNLFNSNFSLYWRVIKATLVQIISVVVIYVLLLMAFGNALMVLSEGRADDPALFSNFFSKPIFDSLMNMYLLSLGEFDSIALELFQLDGKDTAVWIIFIVATFVVQILFLNLLIAAMGDTFDMVKDTEKQSALQASIQLMSDYSVVVSKFTKKEQRESRFVYVTKNTAQDDESEDWEGKLAQLKRHFNTATDAHNVEVTSRITRVDNQLAKLMKEQNNQKTIIPSIKAQLKNDMNEMKSELAQQLSNVQLTLEKVLNKP